MSATESRMPLAEAAAIADRFMEEIEYWTDRVVIAGSIRRESRTVGDIEIVAIPRVDTALDMFDHPVGTVDLLDAHLTMLLDKGRVSKRDVNGLTAWGLKHKRLTFEGAPVDLFCAEAERFGLILAIRTGPAAYSHQLVTPIGQQTSDGRPGLLPAHMRVQGGWLTYRVSGQRIVTPAEDLFFATIGRPCVEPRDRR